MNDPMTTFRWCMDELYREGIGKLYPLIPKYAAHLEYDANGWQDKFDRAVLRWRDGEVQAFVSGDFETPGMAALAWWASWSAALDEVRPLAVAA